MTFFPALRLRLAIRLGYAIVKVTKVNNYMVWEESGGNPDWVTTKITLAKGLKRKVVTFEGELTLEEVVAEYKRIINPGRR